MRFQPSGDVARTGARVVAVARMTASAACLYVCPDGMPSFGGPARSAAAAGANVRTFPHSEPTKLCTFAGTAETPCGAISPSASGCQNVASSTVEPDTPTISGWFLGT